MITATLSLILLIIFVTSIILYALLPSDIFLIIQTKANIFIRFILVLAWLLISRVVSILIYLLLLSSITNKIDINKLLLQIVLVLFIVLLILAIETFFDYRFMKRFISISSYHELDLKVIKSLSIFLKLVITIAIMFILGVKDSAYAIAQANGTQLEMLFIYDVHIMFFASSIAGFDYILDTILSDINGMNSLK